MSISQKVPDPQKVAEENTLSLSNAVFCLDCEIISTTRGDECPTCRHRSLVSLSRMLGGSLFAHRAQQSGEGETGLFDVTIAVELQQIYATDLSATVERLTGVIGPKLARDRATFHLSVKPSANRASMQSSLPFPERKAA